MFESDVSMMQFVQIWYWRFAILWMLDTVPLASSGSPAVS